MPKVYSRWQEKPEGAVYIGRPTKWGNPYSHLTGTLAVYRCRTREEAVREFEAWFLRQPDLMAAAKAELRGKDLWCYCAPRACHGDVLLRIANES